MQLSNYDVVITKSIQEGRLILNIFIHGLYRVYKTSFRLTYDDRFYLNAMEISGLCEQIIDNHMIIPYMIQCSLILSSKKIKCRHVETYPDTFILNDHVIDLNEELIKNNIMRQDTFRYMNKKVTDLNNLMLLKISKAGGIIGDPRADFK